MQTFHADQVIPIVAELGSNHFGKRITTDDLKGKRRTKDLVMCRVVCTVILLSGGNHTLKQVGQSMNRDHSTIISHREIFRQSKTYLDTYNFQLTMLFKHHVSRFFNLSLDNLYKTV